MEMNDMVIISVDDHICEPPTCSTSTFGRALASAPKYSIDRNGNNYWEYQGQAAP